MQIKTRIFILALTLMSAASVEAEERFLQANYCTDIAIRLYEVRSKTTVLWRDNLRAAEYLKGVELFEKRRDRYALFKEEIEGFLLEFRVKAAALLDWPRLTTAAEDRPNQFLADSGDLFDQIMRGGLDLREALDELYESASYNGNFPENEVEELSRASNRIAGLADLMEWACYSHYGIK